MPLHILQRNPDRETVVVFLHGAGLNALQWRKQLDDLSDFHCVAPDLPEHGESAAVGPLTLERCVSGVLEVLESCASGKRVHLVGHSFGATVALGLLKRQPQLFDSALLSGGSAGLSPWLARFSAWGADLTRFMSTEKLVQFSFDQFRIPDSQHDLFRRDLSRSVQPDFMKRLTAAMRSLSLPVDYAAPVLAVVGQQETIPAKQAAKRMATNLKNARAFVVPQVHHVWNLEKPELFSGVIRDWVTDFQVRPPLRPLN